MPRTLTGEDAGFRYYDVTDADGNVIGTDQERKLTVAEANAVTLRTRAALALTTNQTIIDAPTPLTTAQRDAAIKALARQQNGIIRLFLGAHDTTDGA